MVATVGNGFVDGHLTEQRHADLGGQLGAAAGAEQLVDGALLVDEGAHVLDDSDDAQVVVAAHVRGACSNALCAPRGRGHNDHLGAR